MSYNMMLCDLNSMLNKRSWVRYLEFILESLGFYHVWLFQGAGNETEFVSLLWQRSRDTFLQSINEQLNESPRASTYILFHNYGYKSYLNILRIQKYRHALTRFRLSAHRLAIVLVYLKGQKWVRVQVVYRNIGQTLVNSLHVLLNCEIGGLDCHVSTTEYRTRVHCIHM